MFDQQANWAFVNDPKRRSGLVKQAASARTSSTNA
jgi:hypothetical protein